MQAPLVRGIHPSVCDIGQCSDIPLQSRWVFGCPWQSSAQVAHLVVGGMMLHGLFVPRNLVGHNSDCHVRDGYVDSP